MCKQTEETPSVNYTQYQLPANLLDTFVCGFLLSCTTILPCKQFKYNFVAIANYICYVQSMNIFREYKSMLSSLRDYLGCNERNYRKRESSGRPLLTERFRILQLYHLY